MGVTGATGTLNANLPQLLKRIKQYSGNVPTAVGFGVSTREHFLNVASMSDGVVIGSQIITTLAKADHGQRAKAAEAYCATICGRVKLIGCHTTQIFASFDASNGYCKPDGDVKSNGIIHANGTQSELLAEDALKLEGEDPIGGGSNCLGMFSPCIDDPSVKLLGVEAGGDGLDTNRHAATLTAGTTGILHGSKTYVLQDPHGQIQDTHSISAGLDYAGVG